MTPTDLLLGAAGRRSAARAVRALRIQELAAATSRRGDRDPSLAGAAGAAGAGNVRSRDQRRSPRQPPPPCRLRNGADEAALDALAGSDRRGRARVGRHVESTSRSDDGARSSASRLRSSRRSGCYIPFAHRYAGAPAQLDRATACSTRLAPWLADAAAREARPEPQVRAARARQSRHRRCAAARTTRCSSRTCSNRTSRTISDSLARRHLDLPTLGYDDGDRARARTRIPFDQVALDARDRIRGRGRRRHAAAASHLCAADRARREARAHLRRRSSCRCATCCSAWSAPACSSTRRCSPRKAASWASA